MQQQFVLFFVLLAFFGAWILFERYQEAQKKRQALEALKRAPFPTEYEAILESIPLFSLLNEDEKAALRIRVMRFLYLKKIVGKGMALDDATKVTIAFYACFMALKLDEHIYDHMHAIVVLPHALRQENPSGFQSNSVRILEGFALGSRMVITKKGLFKPKKSSVLIHELAHEIDAADGTFDGVPPLSGSQYGHFASIMYKRYKKLNQHVLKGRYMGDYNLLGSYAASNEAEFFAVASELYFMRPRTLKRTFGDVYHVLDDFYGLDMAERSASSQLGSVLHNGAK